MVGLTGVNMCLISLLIEDVGVYSRNSILQVGDYFSEKQEIFGLRNGVISARWELGFEILASRHHFMFHPCKMNTRFTP